METIHRLFRPSFWRLLVPLLIVSTFMAFLTALISTLFESNYPWVTDTVGILFGGYVLVAASTFLFLILSRLGLHSDGSSLDASLFFLKFPVYRRSAEGISWQGIARPGRSQMEIEGIGSYRIEVTTVDGERILFLGPIQCWLFRIECL